MAEELRNAFGAEANIIPGSDGIFEVTVNGKIVFSKAETGRFPNQGEVSSKLKQ